MITRPRVLALSLAVADVLTSAVPVAQAAARGEPSRCGGRGVDADARIRYASDVVIKAPLSTVWKLQTDVERRPARQLAVITAERLDSGRLAKGSRFRWTTPAPATRATPATTLNNHLDGPGTEAAPRAGLEAWLSDLGAAAEGRGATRP
ncbi:hypothetical protein [Streptomyces sp. NPDC006335]|uniref:hypothetical protein n=1 Tax=Streptomyces sp. NPDC006335 TaxID=3156895 RepID=UPI0033A9AB5C